MLRDTTSPNYNTKLALSLSLYSSLERVRDPEFRGFQLGVRNSGKFRNWNSMEFQSHMFMTAGIPENSGKFRFRLEFRGIYYLSHSM
jgi:hypothetical protein